MTPIAATLLLALPLLSSASHLNVRQAASSSHHHAAATHATGAGAGAALPTGGAKGGSIQTGTYQPIAASMTTEATSALPSTPTAGAKSPIDGAPALPASALVITNYPALDTIPPLDSPQMKQWLSQIDLSGVPDIAPTGEGGCSNATNAAAVKNAGDSGSCWWTCGGCTREEDVTACPDVGTWGTSFDDGPAPDTPKLLQFLADNDLKTTFFVVGSRVLSRPEMLQYEYMAGHQVSVHTWSHPALTTISTKQIAAELLWTKKVIKDTIGVTPNTFRPPYGDIDDRVRAVAKAVGLTPIIWTSTPSGQTYDTDDWKIAAGVVSPQAVLDNFNTILNGYTSLSTGFIVLAHDLYQQSVDLAVEFVLPNALKMPSLKLQPIITCLGSDMSDAYIETFSNSSSSDSDSDSPSGNSTSSGGSKGGSKSSSAGAASSSAGSAATTDSSTSDAGRAVGMVGGFVAAVGAAVVGVMAVL